MLTLKHPYPSIQGVGSYGGSQTWLGQPHLKRWGCGLIAAADLLLYLHQSREEDFGPRFQDIPRSGPVPFHQYHDLLSALNFGWFPVVPGLGTNGWMLSAGLNGYFRKNGLSYRCGWGPVGGDIFQRIEDMLRADLPVILSVGRNFPKLWAGEEVSLYTLADNGAHRRTGGVSAHFITVTGMDGEWLQLSTWGQKLYINRAEFARYRTKHTGWLLCSIVRLRKEEVHD